MVNDRNSRWPGGDTSGAPEEKIIGGVNTPPDVAEQPGQLRTWKQMLAGRKSWQRPMTYNVFALMMAAGISNLLFAHSLLVQGIEMGMCAMTIIIVAILGRVFYSWTDMLLTSPGISMVAGSLSFGLVAVAVIHLGTLATILAVAVGVLGVIWLRWKGP